MSRFSRLLFMIITKLKVLEWYSCYKLQNKGNFVKKSQTHLYFADSYTHRTVRPSFYIRILTNYFKEIQTSDHPDFPSTSKRKILKALHPSVSWFGVGIQWTLIHCSRSRFSHLLFMITTKLKVLEWYSDFRQNKEYFVRNTN